MITHFRNQSDRNLSQYTLLGKHHYGRDNGIEFTTTTVLSNCMKKVRLCIDINELVKMAIMRQTSLLTCIQNFMYHKYGERRSFMGYLIR